MASDFYQYFVEEQSRNEELITPMLNDNPLSLH